MERLNVDIIALLRIAYLSTAALILLLNTSPPLRRLFVAYGARSAGGGRSAAQKHAHKTGQSGSQSSVTALLERVAGITVAHSWFASFYVVSVASSLLWATQVTSQGAIFQRLADATSTPTRSMTVTQMIVAWGMLLVQGNRRLYESLVLSKSSSSQIWVGHWALGILFYAAMGIAIWIEGISTIQDHTFTVHDLALQHPAVRTVLASVMFILASGVQHECHKYLATLKSPRQEYKLPVHPAFRHLICPHYSAECLIYLSLAIVAAPKGSMVNWTVASALVFVAVILGVTAGMTKEWYAERFGADAVAGKWKMVPGLY